MFDSLAKAGKSLGQAAKLMIGAVTTAVRTYAG